MDVSAWLQQLGLPQYDQAFRDNDIDGEVLLELSEADLEQLGIASLGHRKKLLKAIDALRVRAAPDSEAPATSEGERSNVAVPKPDARPEAERRQLTVLFCDLVGSTELSARLDPEDMREVITGYQRCCAEVIGSFEGHVAKYMGDGVLAYFGYPLAHEDEAERAVRAGLALAKAVARLRPRAELHLQARIGIATGLVVVGDLIGEGAAQEQAVVGETPNLAARLQELADPGAVVIAPGTQRLVGSVFELTDVGTHLLKGLSEPVQVWCVLGEGRAEGRFEALHGGALTPLVGREQELALLLERWAWAREGEGQVVLLSGEPGIGKSRIVRTLRERLAEERYTPLSHFCSPYHTNSALYPVIRLLERAAALMRDDTPEQKLDKLEALLAEGTGQAPDALPLIADLLGVPLGERYPALGLSPQRKAQRTLDVLIDQVTRLAARQPVLAVYEDVHWIDPTTLELLGLVIERLQHLPVLILITFRPEFSQPWSGHAHVTQLSLSRLTRRHGAAMVTRVTGGKALPAEVLEQIVARTDGVPLFVEELTKVLVESGMLKDTGERFELAGPLPPLAIPATLHDSLMARLDRLAPIKEVAQTAAVLGREFSHALLAAVAERSESQLEEALGQLVRAELLHRRGTPPDATYTFKHVLVRDTAYASLLRPRRRQLHARVVAALEDRFPDTPPELLARHLAEAGLDQRASDAWADAGQTALSRSAMREAAGSLYQAINLLRQLPSTPDRQRRELELLGWYGVALTNTRGPASPEAQEVHERADRLARDLEDREGRFRARWNLWRVHNVRAEFSAAVAIGEALLHEAEGDGDIDHEVQARHALWSSHAYRGDLETTCDHVDRALAIYDADRHGTQALVFGGHDARECALTAASTALFLMGYPERALTRNAEGIAHALGLGQPQVIAHAHNWGSMLLQLAGELDELKRRADFLARLADEHGLAVYYSEARFLVAWLAVHDEGDRRAINEMRDFLDRRAAMGTIFVQTYFLMLLADAWLRLGEPDQALAALDEALAHAKATGEHFCTAELHRLRAQACLAREARAKEAVEASLRASIGEARRRSSRIFELRAATSLAHLWAEEGRRHEAHDLLAPVYAWFTEGFDTADLKGANRLLEELR